MIKHDARTIDQAEVFGLAHSYTDNPRMPSTGANARIADSGSATISVIRWRALVWCEASSESHMPARTGFRSTQAIAAITAASSNSA